MTGKKDTKRRPVALPRLHKAIEDFIAEHAVDTNEPIIVLLDAVQAAWFKDAKDS